MTSEQVRAEAAQQRRAQVARRGDRPSQRRCAALAGARPLVRARAHMQLRVGTEAQTRHFTGVASAYEYPYEMWDMFGPYSEIVSAGAGADSLANPNLDVPLVLNHDSLRRMARTTNGTLTLAEEDRGLVADAPALDMRDADVAYIVPKIEAQLVDEMSFKFLITSGQWSPDYMEYRINGYDINRGDVAIVGYGANDGTSAELRGLVDKLRTGRALDPEDVNMLTQALGWFSSVDSIVDQAQEALAAYLKVPNPDPDDSQQLAKVTVDVLRHLERDLRAELRSRGLEPAMGLHELLAIDAPPVVERGAIPCNHGQTVDSSWDGPAQEAKLSNDAKAATLKKLYAWVDPAKDADTKSAYKFPHHMVTGPTEVGAANTNGCKAGISVLHGGMGGSSLSDADKKGVQAHLAGHLKDADPDYEPPPFD